MGVGQRIINTSLGRRLTIEVIRRPKLLNTTMRAAKVVSRVSATVKRQRTNT